MQKMIIIAALTLTLAVFPAAWASAADGPLRIDKPEITKESVWSGSVVVNVPVTVKPGAVLVIKPGTKVRFAKDAGLVVEGTLVAEGGGKSVITFGPDTGKPEPGFWAGISFKQTEGRPSLMNHVRVEYASAVTVFSGKPSIRDCIITKGLMGISAQSRQSAPQLKGNRISDMRDGGIFCQMGAGPEISGNTIERCGPFGISTAQDSIPVIRGNTVSECNAGIVVSQFAPAVEDNVLRKNKAGIVVTLASKELALRRNRVAENETGILCRQFSNPLVEKNVISGNKQGLVCFMSSSPLIKNNAVTDNGEGISCIQLCNPHITANEIRGNGKGVYLDLSSYATVNGNNIYDNKVQLELGNMSSDWERKVNQKPVRGGQAQNLTRAQRGVAVAQAMGDTAAIMGFVDATGNWWGDHATREMAGKGPDADIESLIDYFDVPVRTYEGYEGEYVQDRIKYEGWKSSKIKDAGI